MEPNASDARRQDRREFVRAVAENLWVRPGTDRPVVKPPFILMLTAAMAIGALATGVVLHFLRPEPKAEAAPPPPPATAFTAVAGWDCAGDDSHGFEAVGRTNAWYTVAEGGWNTDGCNGSFAAVPMSGTDEEDQGQYASWWFDPGDGYTTCSLAAYSPKVVRLKDAAATAVGYRLMAGRSGNVIANFTLDQPADAGRWHEIGSFPSGPDGIAVRMSNAGRPALADGRIAVAQFRARCT